MTTSTKKAPSKRMTKKQRAELEEIQNAALEQVIADQTEQEDEPEELEGSRMAKALNKARESYIKCKASSGKSSLHNGDNLASLLAGCEPEEVAQLADLVCQVANGTHYARYAHLNQGQIRMNSGNKIRGRIKRREVFVATVVELAKANLGTLQGRDEQ